jgi:radical SAM protein with 4Fe4S-binding SPASM domain
MIDEDIMQLIERRDISILLSLDGREERHNSLRGGFRRIRPWFSRLRQLSQVTVALQAAIIPELSENVRYVWQEGFTHVYLNIIENYNWYQDDDVYIFESEYERLVQAMLQGEGILACAIQLYGHLLSTTYAQGCGITRLGLACDWNGRLFPCHRAGELGPEFAIGNIFDGIDQSEEQSLRQRIDTEAFGSRSAKTYPLTSYCPVAIYQKHKDFGGSWSPHFSNMIETKAKIVAKYFYEIQAFAQENRIRGAVHA